VCVGGASGVAGGGARRETCPKGTPAKGGEHCRWMMDIWRPGGGYGLQQVHNIMADVPAENIAAMFDAVNA